MSVAAFVALGSWAAAGELDAEVALDALHAGSTSDAPQSGPQPGLSATELGLRLRGHLDHGRVAFDLDGWGRQPVAGLYPTTPIRRLYRAEGTVSLSDRVSVGLGRFAAPSAVVTLVDGARVIALPGAWRIEAYGGKRGLLLDEAPAFGAVLPIVGAAVGVRRPAGAAELRGSWGGDAARVDDDAEAPETYTAFAAQGLGWVAPAPSVRLGASATVAQRATYLLAAPTAAAPLELQLLSADLYQALVSGSWRPVDDVRVDLDVLRQAALLHSAGTTADPPGAGLEVVDPTFQDHRVRAALRTFGDRGWLRPDARLRLRTDRAELRAGGGVELDRVPGLDGGGAGPYVEAFAWAEDVIAPAPADPADPANADDVGLVDRLLWSAAAGVRAGGFEAEAGASFVERAAAPLSARSVAAVRSEDLSPFALEAQDLLFARAFYARRAWFGGADLEASVRDAELRVFLQVGVRVERGW